MDRLLFASRAAVDYIFRHRSGVLCMSLVALLLAATLLLLRHLRVESSDMRAAYEPLYGRNDARMTCRARSGIQLADAISRMRP